MEKECGENSDRDLRVPLGVYECPSPYHRLMSPELLKWCAETGRFVFLKDTCCNIDQLRAKCKAVEGTSFKIYNAHAASLLESLKIGCAGFSGIMANFHPNLYVWLTENWERFPDKAEMLQNFWAGIPGRRSEVQYKCQVPPAIGGGAGRAVQPYQGLHGIRTARSHDNGTDEPVYQRLYRQMAGFIGQHIRLTTCFRKEIQFLEVCRGLKAWKRNMAR